MKKLNIEPCHEMEDVTFIAFIRTQPHLQDISVVAPQLTDASLDAMVVYLHDLTHLYLYLYGMDGISVDGVCRLIRNCQGLVSACFHACDHIVMDGFSLRLGQKDLAKIRQ